MHRFSCPHCGKHLSYQIHQLGMRIKCPKCNHSIKVGMTEDAAPEGPTGFVAALAREPWKVGVACAVLVTALGVLWHTLR